MTLNEERSEVSKLNARLRRGGLAVGVNPSVAFQSGDRIRLSWPRAKQEPGIFTDEVYASLSEYRQFFVRNHYTCLLLDGAFVQVSYDFKDNVIVGHRFCYYPCPLNLPQSRYATDIDAWHSLLESELLLQIESLQPPKEGEEEPAGATTGGLLRLRSPIRFDYDPEKRTALDPASHVHISDAGVRIPVHAPLSLAQFVHFVVTHFYPSHAGVLADFPLRHHDRCIEPEEETRLHIDCRREL